MSILPQLRLVPHNCCSLAVIVLILTSVSLAANHPPVTAQNANCASCHSDMLSGTSVHAQGELSCNMCHVAAQRDGDADVSLVVPREQACFNCHERSVMQQHWPQAKRECLDCHDAHRSARAMLLRRDVDLSYPEQMASADPKANTRTAKNYPRKLPKTATAKTTNRPGN